MANGDKGGVVSETVRKAPAEHAALVRRETINNTVATAVIAALITWLLFRGQKAIDPLSSPPGGIFGILPGTFNFSLLVTIALTLITRGRVSRQALRPLAAHEGVGLGSWLPHNALARGVLVAACLTALLVPTTYIAVRLVTNLEWLPQTWSLTGMAVFFVCYFVLLSLLVTPLVVWRALHD